MLGYMLKQMFAHFDWDKEFDFHTTIIKLNSFLANDIAVRSFFKVKDEVSSRFDALSRIYHYNIVQQKSPFKTTAYFVHKPLDVKQMNLACSVSFRETGFYFFFQS